MNSTRMTYTCKDCGATVIIPAGLSPVCPNCDGELEETPGATLNFYVATTAAERVKKWTALKEKYPQEAMK
jgi:hypothetical protein